MPARLVNPHIGKFVRSSANDYGIGKIIDSNSKVAVVEYFDSPIANDPVTEVVPFDGTLKHVKLERQMRVYFLDPKTGTWRMGHVECHVENVVFVALPNQTTSEVAESQAYVRWNRRLKDPWTHLTARLTETPFFHNKRISLVGHFIRQRAGSTGLTALISSPIEIERHQIEVIRRVLTDPVQRYLLADEVGLGKTIEAGVILRQYILDNPYSHSILIAVPDGLCAQWEEELRLRCQIGEHYGHQVEVISHSQICSWDGDQPEYIVVDEAHQIQRDSADGTFRRLCELSHPENCPGLLLLSATPVLRNEAGFHALLHLLDPFVYPLDAVEAFRARIVDRQFLADWFAGFTEETSPFFLQEAVDQLVERYPGDHCLQSILEEIRPLLLDEDDVNFDPVLLGSTVRRIRLHLSETYRLHRRILRNRRGENLDGLLTGRGGKISIPWDDLGFSNLEEKLERWRVYASMAVETAENPDYSAAMAKVFAALLESLWCEPLAFLHCIEIRLNRKSEFSPDVFGKLLDKETLLLLAKTSLFEGEEEILLNLLDSEKQIKYARNEALTKVSQTVGANLPDGYRVTCFATCPITADDFHQILRRLPGNDSRAIRHDWRSTDWLQEWDGEGTKILVCDASAEEGLNLQARMGLMVHLDLPLSPNRIEQRIGRMDRFGGGNKVKFFVLHRKECPYWQGWLRCLEVAWKVFSESVADLQYVVEEEMVRLRSSLFIQGESAIDEAIQRLVEEKKIERERLLIRNQDDLDSIQEGEEDESGRIQEKIRNYDSAANSLKCALHDWMHECLQTQVIGENNPADSVIRYRYKSHGKNQTLLPLGEFLGGVFGDALDRGATHPECPPPYTQPVAVERQTARHRNVGLARIGETVTNAIQRHLDWDDRGTSFAMWRQTQILGTDSSPRVFFRLDFIVETELPEHCEKELSRRGDAVFPPLFQTLWVDQDLIKPEKEVLKILRVPYSSPEDSNIRAEHWNALIKAIGCDDWTSLCEDVRLRAVDMLRSLRSLDELCDNSIRLLERRAEAITSQIRSRMESLAANDPLRSALDLEIKEETRLTGIVADGIRNPLIRLDACGVVILSPKPFQEATKILK